MFYLNGYPLSHLFTHFSDKTTQVWRIPEKYFKNVDVQYIEWMFSSEAELMHLAQLVSLLHHDTGLPIELFIRYLPYARQDKAINNEACFALYPFSSLLNTMNFSKVTILDPHSEVPLQLISNSTAVYPTAICKQVIDHLMPDIICYGDESSRNKYETIYSPILQHLPSIYAEKERISSTGEISDFRLTLLNARNLPVQLGGFSRSIENYRALIVDDICDGGATILKMVYELYRLEVSCVDVFLTYGIFSKGVRVLREKGVRRIFTSAGEVFEKEELNNV